MYININRHQFIDAFRSMDRMDNFTYDGLNALFECLEEMERDLGEQFELDVIALCCDFSQDTYKDIAESHDIDDTEECNDDDELKERVIEFLEENTIIVYQDDNSVLYQVF